MCVQPSKMNDNHKSCGHCLDLPCMPQSIPTIFTVGPGGYIKIMLFKYSIQINRQFCDKFFFERVATNST